MCDRKDLRFHMIGAWRGVCGAELWGCIEGEVVRIAIQHNGRDGYDGPVAVLEEMTARSERLSEEDQSCKLEEDCGLWDEGDA